MQIQTSHYILKLGVLCIKTKIQTQSGRAKDMDNKNTKEKQVNYMYFPFDYGGIRGKIKQFFTAVCANTILLAELSPLYFGAAIGADQIIFARTGFADFWLWSILGYILLGAILAAVYLVCLYFGKAGVYLYDDSTVVIKSVITYQIGRAHV